MVHKGTEVERDRWDRTVTALNFTQGPQVAYPHGYRCQFYYCLDLGQRTHLYLYTYTLIQYTGGLYVYPNRSIKGSVQ
jgi:hypothetical protein